MQTNTKAIYCILLSILLAVSARRELLQGPPGTRTTTVTSESTSRRPGATARASASLTVGGPARPEEEPKVQSKQPATSDVRVDVYCLWDVTESTRGTLKILSVQAKDIVDNVFATSQRVRIGVGEYKDTKDKFSFLNHQKITNEQNKVIAALKESLTFQRREVKEESQLFALEKVATGDNIGFRTKKSIKVIVWVGDTKGRDPVAKSTEASVIAALKAKGIHVVAIDLDSLDATGQATRIIKARGGILLKKNADGKYDTVLVETGAIKGSSSGDEGSVTVDGAGKGLSLASAVIESVKIVVRAAEA